MSSWLDARRSGLAVALLVLGSTVVRWRVASLIPGPWYTPDEQTYAELGRSLYSTGNLGVLGRHVPFYSLVYPALAGAPLRLGDTELGYALLKAVQAGVMSLTAVPVYLWARTLMDRWWAVAAVVLTLAFSALVFAGFVMTEVAFYPVLVLAAWSTARMLETPTPARQAVAVVAIAVAALTRLQAVVLAPALLTAVLLDGLIARSPRRVLRFLPAIGALGALAVVWALRGGSALGAYGVTTSAQYRFEEVLRFALYHAADLILFSGLVPVVAVALITMRALAAGRDELPEVRAYVATTVSFGVWLVVEVGAFTTRFLGRLAERNLIALAPLLFLGFALWLDRGAPRPRIPLALAGIAALGLLAYVPWRTFVTPGADPDAYGVIPLRQFHDAVPGVGVRTAVLIAAVALVALIFLVPRRSRWVLAAVTFVLLAATSVSASVDVVQRAQAYDRLITDGDHSWIDSRVTGPVGYVYSGELGWSGGAPVWDELFWNRQIRRVYTLGGPRIYGPLAPQMLTIGGDGRVLTGDDRPLQTPYVVASRAIRFAGQELAVLQSIQLSLWRLDGPARVDTWSTGINAGNGDVDGEARMVVYDCRAGAFQLQLVAPAERTVEVRRNGATFRVFHLEPSQTVDVEIPARPSPRGDCSFAVLALGGIHAPTFRFVRG
jgi:Dolichyl-phosphate-mannose-protein mannosyltransferase